MTQDAATSRVSAAALLRREFDLSFSLAASALPASRQTLLALRVAGEPYAIRADEIAGLFVDRKLVPLPSPLRELLGLAAFRGHAVPVYDLAALLGLQALRPPRWLVLTQMQPCLALAFEAVETRMAPPAGCEEDEVVREGETLRQVIKLRPLVENVHRRAQALCKGKEGSG
ncbi:MAG TPA: chemotaxis protein CheW [Burkholderiaceae bacterium]|nr:chemotaxis protein CheW [Burkholderiaceae bacterium]